MQITQPLAALALVCSTLAGAAQDRPLDPAWEAVVAAREGVLSDPEYARVTEIAYHSAVAQTCEGFALDEAQVAAASNEILATRAEDIEAAELMARQADILITLGTARGLFLAEGALDKELFCAEATTLDGDAAFDSYWE